MKNPKRTSFDQDYGMIILPDEVPRTVPKEHEDKKTVLILYREKDEYSFLLCDEERNILYVTKITSNKKEN